MSPRSAAAEALLASILSEHVVVEEVTSPVLGAVLHPAEEAAVARAVARRREEYTSGRACARRALERLGIVRGPIVSGDHGEPCWPGGVVGSITHCDGYRACAVARAQDVRSVGIDAEPHAPLPTGVLHEVAFGAERTGLDRLRAHSPGVCWDRVLFSAKEAVYKAWFPLARRWLGFEDASVELDADGGGFAARLRVPGPVVDGMELRTLEGRWTVQSGLVLTAVTLFA